MLRLEYHDLLGLFEMLDDGDGEIAIDELLGRSPGNCTLFRVRLPAPLLATQHKQCKASAICSSTLVIEPSSPQLKCRSHAGAQEPTGTAVAADVPCTLDTRSPDITYLSPMIPHARFLENARRLKGPAKASWECMRERRMIQNDDQWRRVVIMLLPLFLLSPLSSESSCFLNVSDLVAPQALRASLRHLLQIWKPQTLIAGYQQQLCPWRPSTCSAWKRKSSSCWRRLESK